MSPTGDQPITIKALQRRKARGERFACLTAYDASFARLLENAGVEVLLVGDSLGMVVQGHDTTLPVTLEEMIYHCACVARGRRRALVMADMPFMSDATPQQALASAGRLLKEGGAQVVKIEGGAVMAETVRLLSGRGIPVCAHLGLLPQSVHKLGGYPVQGRDPEAARRMLEEARLLCKAGADLLLLECVPAALAAELSRSVPVPVIGIGAGPGCDGQVLVLHDILGITPGRRPRFCENFLTRTGDIPAAIRAYVEAVQSGRFPGPEHSYE